MAGMTRLWPGEGARIVILAVVAESSLGVAALVAGYALGHPPLRGLDSTHAMAAAWGALAALPMLALLAAAVRWPTGPAGRLVRRAEALVRDLFAGRSAAELALVCVAAGVGEELLFRGLVQDGLARWIGAPLGDVAGILVASLLFGLAHPISRAYVVVTGLSGLYLGALLVVTESLLAPIAAHALYDFGALVYFTRRPLPAEPDPHEAEGGD